MLGTQILTHAGHIPDSQLSQVHVILRRAPFAAERSQLGAGIGARFWFARDEAIKGTTKSSLSRILRQLHHQVMPDFLAATQFLQFAERARAPARQKRQQAELPFLQPLVRIQ